jgi:uncharacterized membrane protein
MNTLVFYTLLFIVLIFFIFVALLFFKDHKKNVRNKLDKIDDYQKLKDTIIADGIRRKAVKIFSEDLN